MTTATPNQLRAAITEIDQFSQDAFSEIATIAKLALASLETPSGFNDVNGIACVLTAIFNKAFDTENSINCAAEAVACNYTDERMVRRWEASCKADAASTKRED